MGRSAFCERHLKTAAKAGAKQYVVLAAGYDTFAYRQPAWANHLKIFELDLSAMAQDKQKRLATENITIPDNVLFLDVDFNDPGWITLLASHPQFHQDTITFCSLLGISYYLPKEHLSG